MCLPEPILGVFNSKNIGFEIVVDGVGMLPCVRTCRNSSTIIECNPQTTSFIDVHSRERILNYIDPCSFYASFYDVSNKPSTLDNLPTKVYTVSAGTETQLTNMALSNLLAASFATQNNLYIDIRNEHGHSLGYYRYGTNIYPVSIWYAQNQDSAELVTYETHGWPILIKQRQDYASDFSTLSIQFPVSDNPKPLVYLDQGYYALNFPNTRNRFTVLSDSFNTDHLGYTDTVSFVIPKAPHFLTSVRYLKQTYTAAGSSEYDIYAHNYFDNLFELTTLISYDGLSTPISDKPVRWNQSGVKSFVNSDAGYGAYYMADAGVAKDMFSACFFAFDRKDTPDLSHFRMSDVEGVYKQFSYFADGDINVDAVHTPDDTAVNVGLLEILPDDVFAEIQQGEFDVPDGRSLIALFLTSAEFDDIQYLSSLFAEGYDRRLSIKEENEAFSYTGDEYQQYDLVIRGYKFLDGKIVVEEKKTDILIIKSVTDRSRFFFSNNYLADKGGFGRVARNRRDFCGSYLQSGIEMRLRNSPTDEDNANNVITTIFGQFSLDILGKKQVGSHTWYCVEWDENIAQTTTNRGWIRAGVVNDKPYDHSVYITASLGRFIKDLMKLNENLDRIQRQLGYETDNLVQRITRLRQRSHDCDGLISVGKFFNEVIGSDSEKPTPVYLDEIEYEGDVSEYLNIAGTQVAVDTAILPFCDYMGVRLSDNTVIDLHHLFVGWDVLNHPEDDTIEAMSAVYKLFVNCVQFVGLLPQSLGCNVDAATWAGDLGSVSADFVFVQETEKNTTDDLQSMYRRNSSDIDIISDMIPHSLIKYQNRYVSNISNNTHIYSILYVILNDIKNGSKAYIDDFCAYCKIRSFEEILHNERIFQNVTNFSKFWYFYRREINIVTDWLDIDVIWQKLDECNRIVMKEFVRQLYEISNK